MNDKELNERLTTDLLSLPNQIGAIESDLAELRTELRQAKTACEDAEQAALINAVIDGKNETTRKQQSEAAISKSQEVRGARQTVVGLEADIAGKEVQAKSLARQWQSAMALTELQAARINLMARYQPQPKKAS